MIIAKHITNKHGYNAIRRAGEIKPRGRRRKMFETDFLAGDADYVFFSLGEKYQYQIMNETRYFFALLFRFTFSLSMHTV